MWKLLCCWLVMLALPLRAEELSASDLLDEAILWPGDFRQMCRGDGGIGSLKAPHMPGYGSFLVQEYFLSKSMIARLKARRADVVVELKKRLQAFDWEHVPAPDPVPERITQMKDKRFASLTGDRPVPAPWSPQSTRALGGAMLEVIKELNAVEVIPELLHLEDKLNAINELACDASRRLELTGATQPPDIKLPPIDLAGRNDGWESTPDDAIPGGDEWAQWWDELHDHLVFQRNLLGVCLKTLEHKNYAPLKTSLVGRLRVLGLRREGLINMRVYDLQTKKDLKASYAREYLRWDDPLNVPLSDDKQVNIPWSTGVRDSARAVLRAFTKGETPPADLEGAVLLEAVIRNPGGFSQMCLSPAPLPLDVPLSPTAALTRHHYYLSKDMKLRLQANRAAIIPPLLECLRRMDVKQAPKPGNGRTTDTLSPLMLDVIQTLNAVEALPELLRLEADLHTLSTRAEKDPSPSHPNIDSPVSWVGKDTHSEQTAALFACRILHREVLGVIWQILVAEGFPPLRESSVEKQFQAAGRKPLRAKFEAVNSKDEFYRMVNALELVDGERHKAWDDENQKVILTDAWIAAIDYRAAIPYTETGREEMRSVAEEFLRLVPAAKRKAGDAMSMPWLPRAPKIQ